MTDETELTETEQEALDLFKQHFQQVGFVAPGQIKDWSLYTVTRGGAVVGAAAVEHGGEVDILHAIAVTGNHRQAGIGKELVSRAVKGSPTGRLEAKVDAESRANHFYEQSGWQFERTTMDERMNVWSITQ